MKPLFILHPHVVKWLDPPEVSGGDIIADQSIEELLIPPESVRARQKRLIEDVSEDGLTRLCKGEALFRFPEPNYLLDAKEQEKRPLFARFDSYKKISHNGINLLFVFMYIEEAGLPPLTEEDKTFLMTQCIQTMIDRKVTIRRELRISSDSLPVVRLDEIKPENP